MIEESINKQNAANTATKSLQNEKNGRILKKYNTVAKHAKNNIKNNTNTQQYETYI